MKINRLHAIIGFLLVIIPFTGFSRTFKYGFSVLGGGVILFFAMQSIQLELKKKHKKNPRHDTFVESKPVEEKHAQVSSKEKENPAPTPDAEIVEEVNSEEFISKEENK